MTLYTVINGGRRSDRPVAEPQTLGRVLSRSERDAVRARILVAVDEAGAPLDESDPLPPGATVVLRPPLASDLPDHEDRIDYACRSCRARDVKLWRDAKDDEVLTCCDCGAPIRGITTSEVGEDGRSRGRFGVTDQLGDLIPAVPTPGGDRFWRYAAIPAEGREWWTALPLRRA